jgi:hypothetical protein
MMEKNRNVQGIVDGRILKKNTKGAETHERKLPEIPKPGKHRATFPKKPQEHASSPGADATATQCGPGRRGGMKPQQLLLMGILLIALFAGAVSAYTTSESIVTASNVYISNVTYSPGSFFPGDEGTITVKVTNGNTNQGVVVNHATVYDDKNTFIVTSPPFSSSTNIGPGQTQTFVFTIKADTMSEGTFYPIFSISYRDADSLWYRTSIQIEDAPLELTVTNRPDTFTNGGKGTVKVLVWNPRESAVRGVTVVPAGNGITTTPIKAYVGDLAPGASKEVTFEVTPTEETSLTFTTEYLNGVNAHEMAITIPVTFGTDKKGAQIIVNNIESSGTAGAMTIKGDVTNNGLTDAKSVIVTVGSPATPVNPNPVYAIGNLEPDDFSSFEVTYTMTGNGKVPVIVEYKDEDGNVFTETFSISTSSNTAASGSGSAQSGAIPSGGPGGSRGMMGLGSGFNQLPVTQIAVILVAIIALLVAWRKGLLKPLTDRFRKKPEQDDEFEDQ